ncbi:MAG: hypothetical protein AAGF12_30775 [Myxococcota bacterium]
MKVISFLGLMSVLGPVAGCGDDDDPPADGAVDAMIDGSVDAPDGDGGAATAATFNFTVPETGAPTWGELPFPNQLFISAAGNLEVPGEPTPGTPLWTQALQSLQNYDGFCRSCALSFPVTGALDQASLPADAAPGATAAATDAVVMLRADGAGDLIPVEVDFTTNEGALMVRPAGLRVLAPATSYIVAVTSQLMGADGTPARASELFLTVRDEPTGGGAAAERARMVVGPALDTAVAAGVARDSIVALTVYTTRNTGAHLQALATLVDEAALPTATVDRVFLAGDGTLDELLGTPAMNLPGQDNPAMAGTPGETAIAHDAIAAVVLGTFASPRIVEGTGNDQIGFLLRDGNGAVMAGAPVDVPFLLAIPLGADLTHLPVAMAHTGNPGTRDFGLMVANSLAEVGVATLSTDPFLMGGRAQTGADLQHNMRGGDLGPDGLFEHDGSSVRNFYQGLAGRTGDGALLHPEFIHGNVSQTVFDGMMAIRFLREGDIAAVAAADPSLATLAFDADEVFWLGLSAGSMTGVPVVAGYPGVSAAVFNVGPGSLLETVCHGPDLRTVFSPLLPQLGIPGAFDEMERRLCMTPLFNLERFFIEDSVPQTAMHYLFDEPLHAATPPDVLFQYVEFDETIGDPAAQIILGNGDVPVGGAMPTTFQFAEITLGEGPFTMNRTTPNGTITVGGWFFPNAAHTAIIRQRGVSNVPAPIVAPFGTRPEPTMLENPIVDMHNQFKNFFQSRLAGATMVTAP